MLCVDVGGGKNRDYEDKRWLILDIRSYDIKYDASKMADLPFGSDTVDYFYCVWLLPYLNSEQIIHLLTEMRRTMRPNGVLRIGVPDIKCGIDMYLNNKQELFRKTFPAIGDRYRNKTALGRLSGWFNSSIATAFDDETLLMYLNEAGFSDIKKSFYNDSISDVFDDKDTPRYSGWSLYYYVFKEPQETYERINTIEE